MSKDADSISKEDHELNYLLKKFEKRQTEDNRDILADIIDEWRDDEEYKPHNRDSFYDYVEDNDGLLDELEDLIYDDDDEEDDYDDDSEE